MKGILNAPGFGALSQRENEVLRLAAEGCTDVSICRSLGIAPGTLGTYWVRIRNKTTLTSRAELTAEHTRYRCDATLVHTIGVVAEKVSGYGEVNEPRATEIFNALPVATFVIGIDGSILLSNVMGTELLAKGALTRTLLTAHLTPKDVASMHLCLQAAMTSDDVLRLAATVITPAGTKLCNWILKRLSRESQTVLALASEVESTQAAILVR